MDEAQADLIITLDLVEQLGGETYLYGSAPGLPQLTVRQDGQARYDRNQRLGLRLSARRFTFSTRTETRSAFADIAEETISMKALTEGRYRGRDGIWAVFDLGWDTELRVGILEQDIGRVVLKRDGGYRLDRGWSIAPNGLSHPTKVDRGFQRKGSSAQKRP